MFEKVKVLSMLRRQGTPMRVHKRLPEIIIIIIMIIRIIIILDRVVLAPRGAEPPGELEAAVEAYIYFSFFWLRVFPSSCLLRRRRNSPRDFERSDA